MMRILNSECGMLKCGKAALFALCVASVVSGEEKSPGFETQTIRGRVVFLGEVMERETEIAVVPEARERVLALRTNRGELVPLLEDVRARAFRRDDRLRNMEVELVVRRYANSPVVQVIRVFEIAKDGRYEIDYWCTVCSIAMFEKKDCECCQGESELRRRKVD
jgi:hypothetical protein